MLINMERKTARMSTAGDAGEQILRHRIRELIEDNRILRRRVLESKRREIALKDRVIRTVRSVFEGVAESPTSLTVRDAATQTGASPASGSVESAPGPQPATRPTPGASGLGG